MLDAPGDFQDCCRRLDAAGFDLATIADFTNSSLSRVRHAINRPKPRKTLCGIWRGRRQSLVAMLADVPKDDRLDVLLDFAASLMPEIGDAVFRGAIEQGFTPSEAAILQILVTHPDGATHELIMNQMYSDRADPPQEGTVKIYVHRIRAKIRAQGWGARIRAIYGYGYALDRDDGFLFPWERDHAGI